MADVDYDDYDGFDPSAPVGGGGRAQRLINLAGAASSLALVIGLGIWGYKLAVRDVHGVPVIRAAEGPMRIAPEDPGGKVAAHQGLAVNAIAEAGGVTLPAETLTLAPRATELAEDDSAGLSELPPMAEPAVATVAALDSVEPVSPAGPEAAEMPEAESAPVVVADTAEPLAEPEPVAATDPVAVAAALAEAMSSGADPLTPVAPEAKAEIVAQGGMPKSLRPPLRPARSMAATSTPVDVQQVAATVPVPAETQADAVKAGTRLVQLGAFDSTDQARGEWTRLQGRFPDLLGQKSLVVQPAESGGRTFYRLRALGFDDEADARRFCTALLAEGAACIPVLQR